MDAFSAPARVWFEHAFEQGPTEAQRKAWPVIAAGNDTLVIAPTGSGKTLAAFLYAIDGLIRPYVEDTSNQRISAGVSGSQHTREKRPKGVKVLYISPLKALGVDVAKNLNRPLDGIAAECEAMGVRVPSISVAIRSGDTTPRERRSMATHPPDILVTTPESLYLLLTSKARSTLSTVHTVIVDEIHALAGNKRGAHLALSLERLDLLTDQPAQRIGLSATVKPVGEAARFLGGEHDVTVIDAVSPPIMDLRIVEPVATMPDLNENNAKARTEDALRDGMPSISGVTPAMQRLAKRQLTYDTANTQVDGDARNGSIWPVIERHVLDEILAHHTTLVFVNSRGLAERLTARLNDAYASISERDDPSPCSVRIEEPNARRASIDSQGYGGSPRRSGYGGGSHYDAVIGSSTNLIPPQDPGHIIAMAHHGSVSKDRRKRIEEDLKHGRLRCVVATSSLELGIDMGSVDLVIQISPPPSVSSGLQRVGRADHRVDGVSCALFYPLIREQIIGLSSVVECMKAGDIESLTIPHCPLDILAQQTVAAAAMEDITPDDWYATVRRAAPFADLDRSVFESVLNMLSGSYNSEEFSTFRPSLMWNHDDDIVSARPGAQRLAVTSGGTIPDRGLYTVVLPEADAGSGPRRVGELDEEMVYESRIGDVITLGTSTWQIQEITRDRVIVAPAPGRTARLPFWHGDGNGRDAGFGAAQGRFIREISAGLYDGDGLNVWNASDDGEEACGLLFNAATLARLRADGLDDNAIKNLAELLREQHTATGIVPNDRDIVVERCPDEEGDWRVILHSPYGRRVHEPWAMIVSNRIKQRYGYDGQVYAADDGIIVRLPQGDGHIPAADLFLFEPEDVQREVAEQVGESVLFAARFRECAARSLYLPRANPGKRVPLWQQRLRAAQLLNAARTRHNFPLILETTRECLQDVYDLRALHEIMTGLQNGDITLTDVETRSPSPFAENLLFGYVGQVMYQYDQPQAERNASLLSLDFDALERLLGTTDISSVLDPDVIREVERELNECTFWNELDRHDIAGRVTRYAKTHGPFTADMVIADLGIDAAAAVHELDLLKSKGEVLTGTFAASTKRLHGIQYLHRDVFRRIRSRSLNKARQAVKPVTPDVYQSLLLSRQGVGPVGGERHEGIDGLMRVIEQLEGVALPAQVWEQSVFPSRIRGYQPLMLDELLSSGDVVWIGSKTSDTKAKEPGRITFHPTDSALLPDGSAYQTGMTDSNQTDAHIKPTDYPSVSPERQISTDDILTLPEAILHVLSAGGAFRAERLSELTRAVWHVGMEAVDPETGEIQQRPWSDSQFEDALWSLVWQGTVTNSSFAPVRAVSTSLSTRKSNVNSRGRVRRRVRVAAPVPADMQGLWSRVPMTSATNEQRSLARVEALLDRYGVIAASLIDSEGLAGGFSALYPVLRRMEEHGVVSRGMFVQGFGAAQFARRDTVDQLRRMNDGHSQSCVVIDVTDPANLTGGSLPWAEPVLYGDAQPVKLSRRSGAVIVIDHGRPVLYAAVKGHHLNVFTDDSDTLRRAFTELAYALQSRVAGSVFFTDLNGKPLVVRSEMTRILHAAGFTSCPQGVKLYR